MERPLLVLVLVLLRMLDGGLGGVRTVSGSWTPTRSRWFFSPRKVHSMLASSSAKNLDGFPLRGDNIISMLIDQWIDAILLVGWFAVCYGKIRWRE
mmetsp:Transcript_1891/g.4032  ORF Transcript_1891/g.4032 Transcript_1891/m.4032 type:complete len:96 (-) Transcript_1891:186-473(-)